MLKSMLLATAVAFSVPAMAQDVPATPADAEQPATPPESTPIVSEPDTAAAPMAESEPATVAEQDTPATPATPAEESAPVAVAESTEPATEAAPVAAAATKTATTQTEIASVVTSEFANYDKDASGELDSSEFATWMAALRKATDPSFDPAAPDSATWTSQAFAQADADKNMTVNATELTGFLTPKG